VVVSAVVVVAALAAERARAAIRMRERILRIDCKM
jgi:hypothetical protein